MKQYLLYSCLSLSLLFSNTRAVVAADAPVEQFQAGTAKVEITPAAESAVDLFGQPVELRDPLFARVLVLKHAGASLAIVSVDAIVFASPKVIAAAKEQFQLDQVILSSTHTHTGMSPRGLMIKPPTSPDWTRGGKAPADLLDWPGLSADPWYAATEAKIIAAIGEAQKKMFPARIVAGKGPFESAYMAHNRRLVRDGRGTPLWENPDRRPTQPIDPTVGVILVEDLAGKPRACAVHYACHPVSLMGSGVVSRDFPGALVDHLEAELGEDCLGMYLQGAQGDIDPYDLHNLRGENRFNISRQAGISLSKGALRLVAELKTAAAKTPTVPKPALQFKSSLLTLPNRSGDLKTEVGILTVVINQQLALVTIPGEPFIQHQLDLTAKSPIATTLILGLAYYGEGSPFVIYIPTVQAVKEGGYGATECSFLAADAGEKMIGAAVANLKQLAEPK